jgi:tetratricopeptide (TPR) repeat protein/cellulose biosynthesis protein BcsQ
MSEEKSRPPGRIVTFYSYKGGTGRTMALANTACLLGQGSSPRPGDSGPHRLPARVLAVDWDLEAPGLHSYLVPQPNAGAASGAGAGASRGGAGVDSQPGLVDLFEELAATSSGGGVEPDEVINRVSLDRFVAPTVFPNVSVMTAGRFDRDYPARVTRFDWPALFEAAPELIAAVGQRLAEDFDYVLIDSRTGVTDISGICTMLLPDTLVAVFTPNTQSLSGLVAAVRESLDYRLASDDVRPLVVFPLLSRVETARPTLLREWRLGSSDGRRRGFQPEFEDLFDKAYELGGCDLTGYFDEVQIQHVPDYAYGEQIAVAVETTDDRLSLRRSYEAFVRWLVDGGVPWQSPEAATARRTFATLVSDAEKAIDEGRREDGYRLLTRASDVGAAEPAERERLAAALSRIGASFEEEGNLREAEQVLGRALGLVDDVSGVAPLVATEHLFRYARSLAAQGRLEEARTMLSEVLRRRIDLLGFKHPSVADAYQALGGVHTAMGRHEEADALLHNALEIRRDLFGQAHPSEIPVVDAIAFSALRQGKPEMAIDLLRGSLESIDDDDRHGLARLMLRLGQAYTASGDDTNALGYLRKAVDYFGLVGDFAGTAEARLSLASLLLDLGDGASAEKLVEDTYRESDEKLGPDHPVTMSAVLNLAKVYMQMGNLALANRLLRIVALSGGVKRADDRLVGDALRMLGQIAVLRDSPEVAEEMFGNALQAYLTIGDVARQADVFDCLAQLEEGRDHAEAAAEYRRRRDLILGHSPPGGDGAEDS